MLEQLDRYRYRIRKQKHPGMQVDGILYTDETMLGSIQKDGTLQQVINTAMLPGLVGTSLAMPDAHQGYGFCIGGVAGADMEEGVVSCGGVGFDINCGVRLLASNLHASDVVSQIKPLVDQFFRDIPVGTGKDQQPALSDKDMKQVLQNGAAWAVERGYGTPQDLDYIESRGTIRDVNPNDVSTRAQDRGRTQCGTLGSGNHFIEIQQVETVYQPEIAQVFGLHEDQLVVMLHTGSRGLGHQVCTDYLAIMQQAVSKYGIRIPDRQLACAPISSPEGQAYLSGMSAAANYAFANRQILTHLIRNAIVRILGSESILRVVYDIAHNIAKVESHQVGNSTHQVLVHRKGATRAFPKNHPELPSAYQTVGQPVLIPGSMGTRSYVLVGKERAMMETFGSVCHGAGRLFSRSQARKKETMGALMNHMRSHNIHLKGQSKAGLLEESPIAYKNVDNVVQVVVESGLADLVVRLKPMGVIKG
jgi:tRNA-splicing ligase RtcB (3'-phosphate/5'-hydroxy nucleic acid ligase)